MATVEEEENCFGQPIGMLGYPGHNTEDWPSWAGRPRPRSAKGSSAGRAIFRRCERVGRGNAKAAGTPLASWPGFSGSPLFLANGHVTGLHNAGGGITSGSRHIELAYGVRIDCLWELLAYHHLDNKVAIAADKSKLLLDRYNQPDPTLEKYNQAARLVAERINHCGNKYEACVEKSRRDQGLPGL